MSIAAESVNVNTSVVRGQFEKAMSADVATLRPRTATCRRAAMPVAAAAWVAWVRLGRFALYRAPSRAMLMVTRRY